MKAKRVIGMILMIISGVLSGIVLLSVFIAGMMDVDVVFGLVFLASIFGGLFILGLFLRRPKQVKAEPLRELPRTINNAETIRKTMTETYTAEAKREEAPAPNKAEQMGKIEQITDKAEEIKETHQSEYKTGTMIATPDAADNDNPGRPDAERQQRLNYLESKIRREYYPDYKIQAIKFYRTTTNSDLRTATNFVNRVWEKCVEDAYQIEKMWDEVPFVYIPVVEGLGIKWPILDEDEFFHIFTTFYAARKMAELNEANVMMLHGRMCNTYIKMLSKCGICKVRYHGNKGVIEFSREDLALGEIFNNQLNVAMVRYAQAKKIGTEKSEEMAKKYWEEICKIIPNTVFFVPMNFDDEELFGQIQDNKIHLFPGAARYIDEQGKNGKVFVLDGRYFATEADSRKMHFRVLDGKNGERQLACYTNFDHMEKTWKNIAHVALATFDDMKKMYAPADGILINHAAQCMILTPTMIEDIDRMRENR